MTFRKKHREAKEKGENVKVVHAKDSQQDQEQAKDSAAEQATEQTTGQQSGQESGQPPDQDEQHSDEQQSSEDDDKDDDAEPVPDGTTAEILKWVGDDPKRAQRALDKEQADDRPRTGLTGELNKILEK